MDIEGVAALVTGGAGGLGEATVRELVRGGARVVVSDLAVDRGRALADELGDHAVFVETDATSEEQVNSALDAASSLGPVRVAAICHAGAGGGGRTLARDGTPHSLEDFRRTVENYLTGAFNVLRLSAARMAAGDPLEGGERGVVVNTASIAAYEGTIGEVAYSAAKGGVVGMTLTAARDLAVVGVRVVTIAPGVFLTPAYGADPDAVAATWGPVVPFPTRMGRPAEFGALVRHVCENSYLNGEVIRIDGALRLPPRVSRP